MQKRGRRCSTQRVNYSSCVKKYMKNNHDAFAPGPDRSLGCRAWDTRTCQVKRMQVAATRTTSHTRGGHATTNGRSGHENTTHTYHTTKRRTAATGTAGPRPGSRCAGASTRTRRRASLARNETPTTLTRRARPSIPASTQPNRGTCSSAMSIPSALIMPARCCAPSTRPPRVA